MKIVFFILFFIIHCNDEIQKYDKYEDFEKFVLVNIIFEYNSTTDELLFFCNKGKGRDDFKEVYNENIEFTEKYMNNVIDDYKLKVKEVIISCPLRKLNHLSSLFKTTKLKTIIIRYNFNDIQGISKIEQLESILVALNSNELNEDFFLEINKVNKLRNLLLYDVKDDLNYILALKKFDSGALGISFKDDNINEIQLRNLSKLKGVKELIFKTKKEINLSEIKKNKAIKKVSFIPIRDKQQ